MTESDNTLDANSEETGRYPGIDLSAIGFDFVLPGDGNVVNAEFAQLYKKLGSLKQVVVSAARLEEAEKFDVSVDIETIRVQLARANPDRAIATHVWNRIRDVATTSGLEKAVAKVAPLMAELLR